MDMNLPATRHCVQGIENDIGEHFPQLRGVTRNGQDRLILGRDRILDAADMSAIFPTSASHRKGVLNHLDQVHMAENLISPFAGEILQSPYRRGSVNSGFLNDVQAANNGRVIHSRFH